MRVAATIILVAAVVLLPASLFAQTQTATVPANYNPITDSAGFIWDVNQGGGINNGSNSFSSAFSLQIAGNEFSSQQALMTPDGSEYLLTGNLNGIDVQRQVKVDVKNALCRFVETFRNSSGAPQTVAVTIRVQFNNRMQAVLSDTGTPNPGQLGNKEGGLVVLSPTNYNPPPPALLWVLAGPAGKIRPAVRNENNYRLNVTIPLTLSPGQFVSFMHVAAQRQITVGTAPKELAKLFAPLKSPRILSDIPSRTRKLLTNYGVSSMPAGESVQLGSLIEKLGVQRGAQDVLAIGKETRLRGTASCQALEVQTRYGATRIPFEQVAALIGGAAECRILLRDGQALTGKVVADGLKFTLTTGTTMELNVAAIDRLVLRADPQDAPAPAAWAYVETYEGDRLAVKADPALRLHANTAWGVREISPDELLSAGPGEENPLGFYISLKDSSRFMALLDGEEISFDTLLFGRKALPTAAIQKIVVPQTSKPVEEEEERAPEKSQVTMAGAQVISGQIDLAELHFLSPAGVIPVPPNLLRNLRNTSEDLVDETPVFTAELWGGGAVAGTLRETMLPIRSGGALFQVPVREIASAVVPSPIMPEGLRDKIGNLVRELGHPDWEKREAASRELGELGAMARLQIEEATRQTTDAEVKRRAQALLDEMES